VKSKDSIKDGFVSKFDSSPPTEEGVVDTSVRKVTGPDKVAIIVISTLFGPFGAIPANSAAKQAAAKGLPTRPYWKAFWVTWLISSSVLIVAQIIFWSVVIGSLNSSLHNILRANNAGTSAVLLDCSNPSLKIDVDGTVCQKNDATPISWIPVGYKSMNNSSIRWKAADQGSYSCQEGQAHCLAIYAISKAGCNNGITASLNLMNGAGTIIATATGTSNGESPMEIVQILVGSQLEEWTQSTIANLSCVR